MAGCVLLVPAFAAGTVIGEKQARTFDLLNLTLIRPSGIVLGKLLNAVGLFLILVIATLPVFGTLFFLVGFDLVEVFQVSAVILSTAVACAAIGVLCSCLFRRTGNVVGAAYLGMLMLMGLPFYLVWARAALRMDANLVTVFASCAPVLCPISTLIAVFEHTLFTWQFCLFLAYQGIFTVVCVLIAALVLRRPQEPPKLRARRSRKRDARRGILRLPLVRLANRDSPIDDNRNPLLARELRFKAGRRLESPLFILIAGFAVYSLLGAFMYHQSDNRYWPFNDLVLVWLGILIGPAVLLTPGRTANSFTKEYEGQTIDMLRMTLLRPRDIVLGKALAGVLWVTPFLLGVLLSCIVMLFLGARLDLLFTGYVTLVVSVFVSLSLGLAASALTKSTRIAIVVALFFNFFVFLILPSISLYLYPLSWQMSDKATRCACFLSPIMAFFYNATVMGRKWAVTPYWIWNVVLFALFAAGIVAVTMRHFRRFHMRDRG
jgi:ABC-type transport system involved in multi-copper enzyme maturation permease subunit